MSRLGRIRNALGDKRVLGGIGLFVLLALIPATGRGFESFLVIWMMCFAIAALGFNVLLGYTGLLSFGHAAFFGSAAYAMAIGMDRLGIESLIVLLVFAVAVAGLLGLAMALLTLRSNEIYFALLTLALAQLVYVVGVRDIYGLSGGTDGMSVGTPDFLGLGLNELAFNTYMLGFYYYIVLLFLAGTILLMWAMLRSPFGLTLKMIRENPERAMMSGVPVERYRTYSMTLSAMITGLGGALYAVQLGRITPDQLYWVQSGEIVFMALLGGMGTFFGPIVGAAAFIGLQELTLRFTEYWHFVMGLILLIVVVTLREDGIWGGIKQASERFRGGDDS
ncbi:ABC-type transport system permease protein (probable substrate branched-chain amino acids) [Natronomonas pharaonis DSM 2160]|uniref:ABC-type transport system permease protein (Probable substrate branched-chain amino acids) n=1 Tax=Natronomonas pharaonis (strain ATCC 35678 / DSM 2160 / CIP 103997 / JCM 8858 / NBRC 14720 / NCIMB 2260 / Gabara) TaxID=348780 RepID=A0A1U7EX97_NATPD|nr:branched-chain amino acid ABC transporter permease [Natronomonas pharaonis]CAI49805.1 ABC-type transport system permease protein (probable substrate branched-chain amino acids) [Natronomonas pharaonis DSM 2160]